MARIAACSTHRRDHLICELQVDVDVRESIQEAGDPGWALQLNAPAEGFQRELHAGLLELRPLRIPPRQDLQGAVSSHAVLDDRLDRPQFVAADVCGCEFACELELEAFKLQHKE